MLSALEEDHRRGTSFCHSKSGAIHLMLKEIVSDQAVVAVLTLQIVCMLASGSFVWDCNVRMRACDTKDLYVMVLGPWDDSILHLSF